MTLPLGWAGAALIALALLLAVGLTALSYRSTLPVTGGRFRGALFAARVAAFLLLAVALLDPLVSRVARDEGPPVVAVLLDRSRSMSLPAAEGGATRWETALEALWGDRGLVETLGRRAKVEVLGFDLAARPVETGEGRAAAGVPEGEGTDLAAALRAARERAGARLGAVVLLTDGVVTGGGDPLRAARALQVPVHALAAGDSVAREDVALLGVEAPETAYRDSRVTVRCRVGASGLSGRRASLLLRVEGTTLDSLAVLLPADGGETVAELRFTPPRDGTLRAGVLVEPFPGERVLDNNEREFLVTVQPGKLRVVYLEPYPRFDFAFLSRALRADEGFEVSADAGREPLAGSEADWTSADVIILGNTALDRLAPERAERLRRWVVEGGGGLLLLGGQDALRARGRPWDELLPLRAGPGSRLSAGEFGVRLTPRGAAHPLARLAASAEANALVWRSLPPLQAAHRGLETAAGATVLLETASPGPPESVSALFAVMTAGRGKVACLAAAGLWRWDLVARGAGLPGETYRQFAGQVVRWLASDDEGRRVRCAPEKRAVSTGEPVRLLARVADAAGGPQRGASVRVTVGERTLVMEETAGAEGLYQADAGALPAGRYAYRCAASLADLFIGEDAGEFEVLPGSLEFEALQPDGELLRAIAAETGASYRRAAESEGLGEAIEPRSRAEARRVDTRPGRHPLLFTLAGVLLLTEWAIRRRRGLW